MARLSKLAELRAKTDRDLITVINTELDFGLRLTFIAKAESANDRESAETARVRAERVYDESLILLPAVDDLTERQRLVLKLVHLRQALDRLCVSDEVPVQTA